MLVDCPYCKAKVDAKEIGKRKLEGSPDDPSASQYVLAECPSCENTLLGLQYEIETDWGPSWSDATRLFPAPSREISADVPAIVGVSLAEADLCFSAGAFSATAVMCGRALEGICVHFKTKKKTLAEGLRELRDAGVIDKRLYEWGDELRKARNLGAHASDEKMHLRDAEDVL